MSYEIMSKREITESEASPNAFVQEKNDALKHIYSMPYRGFEKTPEENYKTIEDWSSLAITTDATGGYHPGYTTSCTPNPEYNKIEKQIILLERLLECYKLFYEYQDKCGYKGSIYDFIR